MPESPTHQLALAAGTRIDLFRVDSVLGKGGFGITYLAVDTHLGKKVAIKELLPDSIATRVDGSTVVPHSSSQAESWEWARERFLEEARTLAGFSHPAIVGVQRLIEANGTVYLIMDYIEGESYEARLRRIGVEPDQQSLMAVMEPILDGVAEIHAKGLLHRDIKPDNILISQRGQPVLIDFGSARSSIGATMTMTSIVTHGYSPIEQYQTKGRMGPWTDIYSLGAVMCRAITGEKPPVAADRLMDDEFEWLSYRGLQGYSERFLLALDWALRIRPEERPATIQDWTEKFEIYKAPLNEVKPPVNCVFVPPILAENHQYDDSTSPSESDQRTEDSQPHHLAKIPKNWLIGIGVIISVIGIFFAARYVDVQTQNVTQKRVEREKNRQEQQWSPSLPSPPPALNYVDDPVASLPPGFEVTEDDPTPSDFNTLGTPGSEHAQSMDGPEGPQSAEIFLAQTAGEVGESSYEGKTVVLSEASKENPYINSLGMKFVPVKGISALFSSWETRVQDYEAYAKENPSVDGSWRDPGFDQGKDHPVVNVSWEDAKAFCAWLTKTERAAGRLGANQEYRLPTDAEWSVAVGLVRETGRTPKAKSGQAPGYPWGSEWPPPRGAGNYDSSLKTDDFQHTSPVGVLAPNQFGIHDMGGNVWEWCEDFYEGNNGSINERVLRGASWPNRIPDLLLSSYRNIYMSSGCRSDAGFRCVLAGVSRAR